MTIVSIACNDPDNGIFSGRCTAIAYDDLELQHDDWLKGCAVSFLDGNKVRIGRMVFSYQSSKYWFGNWCWMALRMDRKEARRLLRWLRGTGYWYCECGPTRLYDWFNRPCS